MNAASAPAELPFAPRPFAHELFSSWLMRIADANCVSLEELMLGFECRYPKVPWAEPLDWNLSPPFLKAMARFCRTSVRTLRTLDIPARLPHVQVALLLHPGTVPDRCPRLRNRRTGYAFCPTCISKQPYVHVRWEWAFPALLRCHVHKIPLRLGCHLCGEDDPLPFGAVPTAMGILCQSCRANLSGAVSGFHVHRANRTHSFLEKTYHAALRGAAPGFGLLGETTGTQFCRFVADLLQLLAWYPSPDLAPRLTDPTNRYLPFRTEILAMVGALVRNAAPSSDRSARRDREGTELWLRVLSLLSEREEEWIEIASELWPTALRQRLHEALDHHERFNPRRSQFRSPLFRPGLKYINHFKFRDLSAANQAEHRNSGI
jgi:hypothetical protein